MKFGFIAKHRGTWPVRWLCAALGVSRSGFHGWLTRPRSVRAQADDMLTAKVRASFVASSRTYGARRVWHDVLADGGTCGLHRIERLMRAHALRARPRRRGLPVDTGVRATDATAPSVWTASLRPMHQTKNGWSTSPTSGPLKAGFTSPPCSTCSLAVLSAGR